MSRRATLYDQRPQMAAPVATRSREYEEVESYTKRPERRNRPEFLSKDYDRSSQGPLVVRDPETSSRRFDRQSRPGSPMKSTNQGRTRDPSLPPLMRSHARVVEREREKVRERSAPPPSERVLARIVDPRDRIDDISLSTPVDRREKNGRGRVRERSLTPPPAEPVNNRKTEREESHQTSQVSSPPTPPPIHAPPIHQEIITHHRHINHGFETARPLTPPLSSRREVVVREPEVDEHTSLYDPGPNFSRRETSESVTLARRPRSRQRHYNDDSLIHESEKRKSSGQEIRIELSQRRSKSAHHGRHREEIVRIEIRDDEDEADYYTRKNDEHATIGEAKNGVTKDWATIDVPPGTERVILDGVGGASQEITWQKYNGVRRSRFIPDREHAEVRELSPPPQRENTRKRLEFRDDPEYKTTNLEIGISHNQGRRKNGAPAYDHEYEREYERVEEDIEYHDSLARQPRQRNNDLWTEITKDLVTKEAIIELGYEFEETDYFYYILQYLQYEDVVYLVNLSDQIRQERQQRLREIEWERRQLEMREME
ncbi:hypothetical protein K3495_g10753 [Podosphaera aphanis]|nr:hypothetical protein K3495_g10753 [Podosphaera aphanis]